MKARTIASREREAPCPSRSGRSPSLAQAGGAARFRTREARQHTVRKTSINCRQVSPSAAVQEPPAPRVDRRTAHVPPRVVDRAPELLEHGLLLAVKREVGDVGGKDGEEGEGREAEVLRTDSGKRGQHDEHDEHDGPDQAAMRSREKERRTTAARPCAVAVSPLRPRSTLATMLPMAFSSSAGTSATRVESASRTLARSEASGRSSEVMRRGMSCEEERDQALRRSERDG